MHLRAGASTGYAAHHSAHEKVEPHRAAPERFYSRGCGSGHAGHTRCMAQARLD